MFRSTSILVQLAGLAAAALCLEGSRDRKPEPLETPQAITATILRLEGLLDEAESHHRVTEVEKLIADDYRGVSVGGSVIAKRDVLAAVGGKEEAFLAVVRTDGAGVRECGRLHGPGIGPGRRREDPGTVHPGDTGNGRLAKTRRRVEVSQ
jgi:hypothetical protein